MRERQNEPAIQSEIEILASGLSTIKFRNISDKFYYPTKINKLWINSFQNYYEGLKSVWWRNDNNNNKKTDDRMIKNNNVRSIFDKFIATLN